MSDLIDIDGVLVDEDGVIHEVPAGGDVLAMVASRVMYASEQRKEWEKIERALKRALVAKQPEKKAIYGDVVVSIRQGTRADQDIAAIREAFAEVELTRDEAIALAMAGRDFDAGRLEDYDGLLAVVAAHTHVRPTAPYAIAERVRRDAPPRRSRAVDLTEALEESLAAVAK